MPMEAYASNMFILIGAGPLTFFGHVDHGKHSKAQKRQRAWFRHLAWFRDFGRLRNHVSLRQPGREADRGVSMLLDMLQKHDPAVLQQNRYQIAAVYRGGLGAEIQRVQQTVVQIEKGGVVEHRDPDCPQSGDVDRGGIICAEAEKEIGLRVELKERIDIRGSDGVDLQRIPDNNRQNRRIEFGRGGSQLYPLIGENCTIEPLIGFGQSGREQQQREAERQQASADDLDTNTGVNDMMHNDLLTERVVCTMQKKAGRTREERPAFSVVPVQATRRTWGFWDCQSTIPRFRGFPSLPHERFGFTENEEICMKNMQAKIMPLNEIGRQFSENAIANLLKNKKIEERKKERKKEARSGPKALLSLNIPGKTVKFSDRPLKNRSHISYNLLYNNAIPR